MTGIDPNTKRGAPWMDAEIEILRAHSDLSSADLVAYLPQRTAQAIGNLRTRRFGSPLHEEDKPTPAVKAPGEYAEHLADLLVDNWECLEIWLRWNGYASGREVSRSLNGWVTLICTAKGWA